MNGPSTASSGELRVLRDRLHRLPGHVLDQVDIAGLQRGDAQVLVRIGDARTAFSFGRPGL